MEGKFDKFFDNATHYFSKTTDKKLYTYRNIMEYVNGEYVITNKISDKNLIEMRNNMDESDVEDFDKFVNKFWGDQTKVAVGADSTETVTKKRGRKPKAE